MTCTGPDGATINLDVPVIQNIHVNTLIDIECLFPLVLILIKST